MAITAADIRREVKEKNVTFLRLMFSDIPWCYEER